MSHQFQQWPPKLNLRSRTPKSQLKVCASVMKTLQEHTCNECECFLFCFFCMLGFCQTHAVRWCDSVVSWRICLGWWVGNIGTPHCWFHLLLVIFFFLPILFLRLWCDVFTTSDRVYLHWLHLQCYEVLVLCLRGHLKVWAIKLGRRWLNSCDTYCFSLL